MKIEKTEIWIKTEKALQLSDGKAVRGFFGNLYKNRPEFHGHLRDKLIYKHPLIQYKIFGDSALVVGLREGAYLLKAVPELEYLEIYYRKYPVIKQNNSSVIVPFGIEGNVICYIFITPWIGLNKDNYRSYMDLKKKRRNTGALLDKILTGNILSMCKSVGYTVKNAVYVKSKLEENIAVKVKEDTRLIAFKGEFETNFLIPDLWGIGGKVSLGYGTVKCTNGGNTRCNL